KSLLVVNLPALFRHPQRPAGLHHRVKSAVHEAVRRLATSGTGLNPASRLHRPRSHHRAKAVWHESVAVREYLDPISDAGSPVVTVLMLLAQTVVMLHCARLFAALLSFAVQPFP